VGGFAVEVAVFEGAAGHGGLDDGEVEGGLWWGGRGALGGMVVRRKVEREVGEGGGKWVR
jgi:hypothetical protein